MSSKEQIPDSDASEEDSDAERVRTPDPRDIEEPSRNNLHCRIDFENRPKRPPTSARETRTQMIL